MAMNDCIVIEAIRNNKNDKALSILYDHYLPEVKKYIRSNNGKGEDAEDMFQDALVILYKYIKTGQYDESYSLGGFLMTVCKNLWINKAKKDSRNVRIDKYDMPDHNDVVDDMITQEREKMVADAMSELGPRCQELLMLSNFEKLSSREIAEKMGFESEDAVKTRKYKCMQRLMEIVKNKQAKG